MISVTDEQVTEAIQAVVTEAGRDYVYPLFDGEGCFYVYDDKPSCIVGKVLFRLGAVLYDLTRCDDYGSLQYLTLKTVGIEMSEAARTALRYAQITQDLRHTWGEALDQYLEVLDHHGAI